MLLWSWRYVLILLKGLASVNGLNIGFFVTFSYFKTHLVTCFELYKELVLWTFYRTWVGPLLLVPERILPPILSWALLFLSWTLLLDFTLDLLVELDGLVLGPDFRSNKVLTWNLIWDLKMGPFPGVVGLDSGLVLMLALQKHQLHIILQYLDVGTLYPDVLFELLLL